MGRLFKELIFFVSCNFHYFCREIKTLYKRGGKSTIFYISKKNNGKIS